MAHQQQVKVGKLQFIYFPCFYYTPSRGWPSHCNLTLLTFSQLPLSDLPPVSVSFVFSYTHTHTASPINTNFKRLLCGSYRFLCFGCCALRGLKAQEPVVFLSKPFQPVCKKESVPKWKSCTSQTLHQASHQNKRKIQSSVFLLKTRIFSPCIPLNATDASTAL